jgi:hypothetical protein
VVLRVGTVVSEGRGKSVGARGGESVDLSTAAISKLATVDSGSSRLKTKMATAEMAGTGVTSSVPMLKLEEPAKKATIMRILFGSASD